MGIWNNILKYGSSLAKGTGNHVFKPIGKSMVNTVANPTTAVGNVAKTAKVAALPAAGGYLAWQNIANDKSMLESVKDVAIGEDKSAVEAASDVLIGEKNTNRLAGAIDSVATAADKASETMDNINNPNSAVSNGVDGISGFFRNISSGDGLLGMMGNLFSNIFKGNVSGMSMVGLLAAAYLSFGRWGWMTRIAGALMGMMLIGNNSRVSQSNAPVSGGQQNSLAQNEEQSQSRGMRR